MNLIRAANSWKIVRSDKIDPKSLEEYSFDCGYRVNQLCETIDLSEQHLRRIVTRDIGLSLKAWMNMERMVKARHLLRERRDIESVSAMLRFAHTNSFRRAFKTTYGVSPSKFLDNERSDI